MHPQAIERHEPDPQVHGQSEKYILSNPRTPLNKLARDGHVSSRTTRRAVNDNLAMRSFARRLRNPLTEKGKETRREQTPVLLNHLKRPGSHVKVFMDDNNFTVDEVASRQNTTIIATSPAEVPPVLESKHGAAVMVLGAVTGDGCVIPPQFVPAGLRIGTTEYLFILEGLWPPGWSNTTTWTM